MNFKCIPLLDIEEMERTIRKEMGNAKGTVKQICEDLIFGLPNFEKLFVMDKKSLCQ